MSDYETTGSRIVYTGSILTMRVDDVRMPSGRMAEREYVTHRGAVGIVPLTDANEIVLVNQYRHPVGGLLKEIPAGKLDPGETPAECARRELIEEVGLAPEALIKLSTFYTTPGYSNELFHLFVAYGLTPEPSELTEEEIESVEKVSIPEAIRQINAGLIEDGKTIAAVGLVKIWLEAGGRDRGASSRQS
jgi:ADP-ribose pyrophosphatase